MCHCSYGIKPNNMVAFRRDCTGSEQSTLGCPEVDAFTCDFYNSSDFIALTCNHVSAYKQVCGLLLVSALYNCEPHGMYALQEFVYQGVCSKLDYQKLSTRLSLAACSFSTVAD